MQDKDRKMNIAVIGGGASGMVAAITAARSGAEVTIFEHMPRMGKKLLLTGSGKCNITNADMDMAHYHSGCIRTVESVLQSFPRQKTLEMFESLGLYVKDKNGYMYPYCESASAVVDVLRFAIRDLDIDVHTDTNIRKIEKMNQSNDRSVEGQFVITTNVGTLTFDRVILCCGSNANRNTGSDGSGYKLASKFGHKIINPLPALTYLDCEESFYPSLAGIRTGCKVSLFSRDEKRDSQLLGKQYGQIQFTKKGISGICVFNLSHFAARKLSEGEKVLAMLDLLPDVSWDQIHDFMTSRIDNIGERCVEELFIGLLAKPLGICICKRCSLDLKRKCADLTEDNVLDLCKMIKDFETSVVSTGDVESSQVISGGVDMNEVSETLESKLVSGLYFAGEILDVNGDCGGYNLQWAQSSGMCAGSEASH